MSKREIDYQETLLQDLQDPKEAADYLNAALMDEDPRIFLVALNNVLQAQGKTKSSIAKEADLNRENMFRMLSPKGNPKLTSISALLHVIGFQLAVKPYKHK